MTQTVQLKRSATAGAIPSTSDLSLGELAINTYDGKAYIKNCLLYTSPSPRDLSTSRMPSSA